MKAGFANEINLIRSTENEMLTIIQRVSVRVTRKTTITVESDVHEELKRKKRGDEDWTAFLSRLLKSTDHSENDVTGEKFEQRLRAIESQLNNLPRDVASEVETRFR